jgi:hypothetical protein
MNHDDKTMLALAALTYRGFGSNSEAAVDRALRPWLPKLEAEGLGRWELVWGPATFRAPTSLFDDAMMYVAQQSRPDGARPRYVIAIRGTNPVSVFDWVFGDLWVGLQVDWAPASATATGAQVSASTALGLAIIQHLAAEVPPTGTGRLASLGRTVADALEEFAQELPEFQPDRLLKDPDSLPDALLIARINTLSDRDQVLRPKVFSRLSTPFLDVKPLQDAIGRRVLKGLLRQIAAAQGPGKTLLEFLNNAAGQNASIAVTGHSKGGALAVATALWLAENWAPARQAEIECFSFAGPTAGNAAFAARYNARLSQRTRSIVNRRDIVPQAWVPKNLQTLPELYPALGPAVKLLNTSIEPLGYTHVGGPVIEISSTAQPGNLAKNLIYQHLDAYLADAAFQSPVWNALSIFLSE